MEQCSLTPDRLWRKEKGLGLGSNVRIFLYSSLGKSKSVVLGLGLVLECRSSKNNLWMKHKTVFFQLHSPAADTCNSGIHWYRILLF